MVTDMALTRDTVQEAVEGEGFSQVLQTRSNFQTSETIQQSP